MQRSSGILFVLGTLEVGGSETKVVKIANALAADGYPVGIAYLNPPETLLGSIAANISVTHLERRGKYSTRSLRRLRSLVGAKYSLLFSVNFYPLLYVIPALKLNAACDGRAICLVNTTEFVDRQWIWGHFYAPFLRRCNKLIYGCKAQQRLWTSRYNLPADRSSVIYNGVDATIYSPDIVGGQGYKFRAEAQIPREAVVFGSVGRLAPEKNFELLIRAIGNLRLTGRDAYLVLVGDGKERMSLREVADECGLGNRVIFTGTVRDVRPLISAMDVFVLPSRAVETFSNAGLEAMAMERPVVMSNIGGAAEMIEQGKNGYLFENGNVDMLTGILTELYDSKNTRYRVGHSARVRAAGMFGFASMLKDYKTIISEAFSS